MLGKSPLKGAAESPAIGKMWWVPDVGRLMYVQNNTLCVAEQTDGKLRLAKSMGFPKPLSCVQSVGPHGRCVAYAMARDPNVYVLDALTLDLRSKMRAGVNE